MSADGPATAVASSGGALTSGEYRENSGEPDEIETEAGNETETVAETEAATESASEPGTDPSANEVSEELGVGAPLDEQAAAGPAETEQFAVEAVALSAAVGTETEPIESEATVPIQAPAEATIATTTTATTASVGLPSVALPPYPVVPGATPTQVAIAVVVVLARALQTAISGPVPNPIAIPIYMLLVAAYQRLTQMATNHLPTAAPTTSLVIGLTGEVVGAVNPADPDGDPVIVTLRDAPAKGTVVVLPNGTYTYLATDASLIRDGGTDTFTVTLDDSLGKAEHFYAPNGHTIDKEITITLPGNGINVPPLPTAAPGPRDSMGVIRGRINVLDLDDDTHTFSLANGNSAGATATSAYTALGGLVTLNTATGDWTYIPAVSGNVLGIPTHIDSFVVTVDDGHTLGEVPIVVSVAADLDIPMTNVSTNPASNAVSGTLAIPASNKGLLMLFGSTIDPARGTLTVDPDGSFVYTPTAAARHAAAANNATQTDRVHTFSILGADTANGRTITLKTVEVTIAPVNQAPAGTATFSTPGSDGVVTGSVSVTDGDGDTLTYSGSAGKGSVTFDGTNFTYTPTATARHAAAAENATTASKQDTITISVSDAYGGVKTFTQTIAITPQNTAPTHTGVTKSSGGLLGLTKTWTVNGIDDADDDNVVIRIVSLPTGGLVNLPVVLGNTVTLVSLLTDSGKTFVISISDGHGGDVPITLTV